MSLFNKRIIKRSKTLGERLKKVRQEAGISLTDAEQATQIRRKYLEAIEGSNYSALPGPVYIENFLKKYAEFLKVSSDFVLNLYHQQDKKVLKKEYQPTTPTPRKKLPKEVITPRLMRIVIISLIVVVGLTYLGLEITKIFSPPELSIISPNDYLTVTDNSIEVLGTTEPEALVKINGKQVFLNENGGFSELVNLNEGLNTITVTASKKRSKDNTIIRNILLKNN